MKGLFSACTLFTLYAFFVVEVDQQEMPSNFFVQDMADFFLLWTVDYPDTRKIHATYSVPLIVFNRVICSFSQRVLPLTQNWINGGDVSLYFFFHIIFFSSPPHTYFFFLDLLS